MAPGGSRSSYGSGYKSSGYGYSSGFSTGIATGIIMNNAMMRTVLGDDYTGYRISNDTAFLKGFGEIVGGFYCVFSLMNGLMEYQNFSISTRQTNKQLPTHLYELYHKNNKPLGSVFYYGDYTLNDCYSLFRHSAYKISEIRSQPELDLLLSKHPIVPNTTSITYPVTLAEYKFPNGVFKSIAYDVLHTDKKVLRRNMFWRGLLPGTTIIAAATTISVSLW